MLVIPIVLILVFGSIDYHRQAELNEAKQTIADYERMEQLKAQIRADIEKEANAKE